MLNFLNPILKRTKNLKASREHVAVLEAIIQSLMVLDNDTAKMKLELMILTATGKWLDTWGEWFGVPRLLREDDVLYGRRIVSTTVKHKNTIPAIIEAVNEFAGYTGNDTHILEPNTRVAMHNISEFSGDDVYQSGDYWRSGVMDIVSPVEFTPDMINLIKSIKAAGTKVFFTRSIVLGGDPGILEMLPLNEPMLERTVFIEQSINNGDILVRSDFYRDGVRSGRRNIVQGIISETSLTKLTLDSFVYPSDSEILSLKYPGRSSAAFRSGIPGTASDFTGGFSGYPVGAYDIANPLPWFDDGLQVYPKMIVESEEDIADSGRTLFIEKNQVYMISPEAQNNVESPEKWTQFKLPASKPLDASSLTKLGAIIEQTILELLDSVDYHQADFETRIETIV